MKILNIGPKNAGKTVFLARITNYATRQDSPVPIHIESFAAAAKIEEIMKRLENGEWPLRNFEGSPQEIFTFRLGSHTGKKIQFWDFPGEDYKKCMTDPTAKDLSGDLKKLRETIEEAHMLIYLLDLDDLLKGNTDNTWLFRDFLINSKWKNHQRIVVLTKADRYSGHINQANGNIKKVVMDAWPQGAIACPFISNSFPEIDFFAVTCVKTENRIKNGQPKWMPKPPLESEGLDPFLQRVHLGLTGEWKTNTRNAVLNVKRGFSGLVKGVLGMLKKSNLLLLLVGMQQLATVNSFFKSVETAGATQTPNNYKPTFYVNHESRNL
jgi:hypothetical protein